MNEKELGKLIEKALLSEDPLATFTNTISAAPTPDNTLTVEKLQAMWRMMDDLHQSFEAFRSLDIDLAGHPTIEQAYEISRESAAPFWPRTSTKRRFIVVPLVQLKVWYEQLLAIGADVRLLTELPK